MIDLNSWMVRVKASVDALLRGFEERLGYPPGENVVVTARRAGGAVLADELDGRAPAAVIEFFDVVEEVSLPDVWNGYFLGPIDRVISAYANESPRFITLQSGLREVLPIGSDGGGALYCAAMDDAAPVFRLDQVSIRRGVATTPPAFTRQLAPDFASFLDALAFAIESSVQGSETPAF